MQSPRGLLWAALGKIADSPVELTGLGKVSQNCRESLRGCQSHPVAIARCRSLGNKVSCLFWLVCPGPLMGVCCDGGGGSGESPAACPLGSWG